MKQAIVVPGQGILTKEYLIQQNIYDHICDELKLILGDHYKLDFDSNIVLPCDLYYHFQKFL